ncbi:MAG: hypothetical protein IKO19_07505 [Candidatus Riflebacteria bacterium]|nr:hypothetical protein [Candidatus Riflebacteria bacterium]
MLCPGCGFENENDNKFCNMCGMALPEAGNQDIPPAEREQVSIDNLSFDDFNLDTSSSSNGLDLDLSSSDTAQNDNSADFNFDLSANSEADGGLNLDLNTESADFNFDSSDSQSGGLDLNLDTASSDNLELDLDLNADTENSNTISIETPEDSSDDPFAAPAEFDMTMPEQQPAEEPATNVAYAPQTETVETSQPKPEEDTLSFDITPQEETSEQPVEFDLSASSDDQTTNFDTQDFNASTESFDFGDLDSGTTETVESTPTIDDSDDDLSGLIVSSNDDFSTPSPAPASETTEDFSITEDTTSFDTTSFDVASETPAVEIQLKKVTMISLVH